MRCLIAFGRLLVLLTLSWSLAQGAPAQPLKPVYPGTSTLRGTLKSGGAPVNGPVEVRVQLFDAPTGGNPVTQDPVSFTTTAVNGDFSSPLDVFRLAGGDAVSIRDCFRGAQNGFLQISVRRPGEANFSPLSPRQSLASIPLSLFAGNAINAERASVAEGLIDRSLLPSALQMAPNAAPPSEGQILSYRNGAFVWTDSPLSPAGNAAGGVSLNLGSLASFRFQPGNPDRYPSASPNLISGVLENRISSGDGGNVIAGGGLANAPNVIQGNQNFIGSGILNFIGPKVDFSVIGAGASGVISESSSWSFIGSGYSSSVGTNAPYSFIGAAYSGKIGEGSASSVIGGGYSPLIGSFSPHSVLVGGRNCLIGYFSEAASLVGGYFNAIGNQCFGAFIGGGTRNEIAVPSQLYPASDMVLVGGAENSVKSSNAGAIVGGWRNQLDRADYSVLGGGSSNLVASSGSAVISGGANNRVISAEGSSIVGGGANRVSESRNSAIGGGSGNWITRQSQAAGIAGGESNGIGDDPDQPVSLDPGAAAYSSIGGGLRNRIHSVSSVVGGGQQNTIKTNSSYSVIAGGDVNRIESGSVGGAIGGGENNELAGRGASIPGGVSNRVLAGADFSLAAGTLATAKHPGSFVWSDGTANGIVSARANDVTFQAVGGVRMITGRPDGAPPVGAELLPGSGSWSSMSDRNAKTNVASVNPRDILDRVARLPIGTWNYRSQDETVRHIGPMAQDFRESFGLGEDDRHISAVDADGVALAAIQGLNQRLEEQRTEIALKDGQVTDLQKRVAELESLVRQLVSTRTGGDR